MFWVFFFFSVDYNVGKARESILKEVHKVLTCLTGDQATFRAPERIRLLTAVSVALNISLWVQREM